MITKYNDTDLQNLLSFIPGLTGRTVVDRANLYFSGVTGGSEFVTYAVTKIYLCRMIAFGVNDALSLSNSGGVNFYNQNDAMFYKHSKKFVVYYGGATDEIYYAYNSFALENFLFSRFHPTLYSSFVFYGMRITLSV